MPRDMTPRPGVVKPLAGPSVIDQLRQDEKFQRFLKISVESWASHCHRIVPDATADALGRAMVQLSSEQALLAIQAMQKIKQTTTAHEEMLKQHREAKEKKAKEAAKKAKEAARKAKRELKLKEKKLKKEAEEKSHECPVNPAD